MSYTALSFYREEQTLDSLKNERPKSMDVLRAILYRALEDIETRLQTHEAVYYGGQTCEKHILGLLPDFREGMAAFQVQVIHGSWQIDDITRRFEKHAEQYGTGEQVIQQLRDFTMRMKAFIPLQFEYLSSDVKEIMRYTQKYCLSFFTGKKNTHVETPYHYTLARQEYIGAIKLHLNNITNMSKSFRQGGLTMKMFGPDVQDIGRRTECADLPVLLVFPEACANIRLALKVLHRWLTLDAQYNTYLFNDLREIAEKRKCQEGRVRDYQKSAVLLEHQIKVTLKEVEHLKEQLVRLQPRAQEMEIDLNRLKEDITDLKTDIALKEEEISEKRMHRSSPTEESDAHAEAAGEITRMKLTILVLQRQLDQRRGKMGIILEKRELLETKMALMRRCEKMKVKTKTELRLARHDLDQLQRSHETLKNIYKLRRSPDITNKIFRNLPLEARNSRLSPLRRRTDQDKSRRDALERASDIVAEMIGSDWSSLYRSLPFFPFRGQATLDSDVDDIFQQNYRSKVETQARESLARWRRMHAYSSLVDLERTVKGMQRDDILKKLAKIEFPREPSGGEHKVWKRYRQTIQAMKVFMAAKTST